LSNDIVSLFRVMMADPDLFRLGLDYIGTLTPVQKIMRRPGVKDAIAAATDTLKQAPPIQVPGPNRTQLLDLVA